MTTPLARELVEHIRSRGAISFAEFMQRALYDADHGYYAGATPRTGLDGDYVTSPELDPAFGELWMHAFEVVWDAAGRPSPFAVVEIGPGEGGFAAAVLSTATGAFLESLSYTLVERSASARARQRGALGHLAARVTWVENLGRCRAEAGVVFANEVLDNVPVHVVARRDESLLELAIDVDDHGRLSRAWKPLEDDTVTAHLERFGIAVPEGAEVEVSPAAIELVLEAAAVIERGLLVWIDYGRRHGERDPAPTLASYSAGAADTEVLARPGARDVTAHVDWDAVVTACRAAGMTTSEPVAQSSVLRALGAGAIDERLRDQHRIKIEAGDGAGAVRALSRRQALAALLDPGGLGGLQVVVAARGMALPSLAGTDWM